MNNKAPKKSIIEPEWKTLDVVPFSDFPADVAAWLKDQGSLTKILIETCSGQFNVEVQSEITGFAAPSEHSLLDLTAKDTTLVREVKLRCDEQPWVFARTLIPSSSIEGAAACLAHLKNRPLGALLFADPNTERCCIEVACLKPQDDMFSKACSHLHDVPQQVWARRTLFKFLGEKILVNEVFLPALIEKN